LQNQSISQYLRIQPRKYGGFPYVGCWKEREGREGKKYIYLSTPAQGHLTGIPYAGWWRVRERKRERRKLPFGRE
jgi:hypothetical protein